MTAPTASTTATTTTTTHRTARAAGALPLVGHVPALFRHPLPFLRSLADQGDLVELRLGPQRAMMVCTPDLFHHVLTDTRHFDKGGPLFDKLRWFLGDGLGSTPHDVHRRQRRQLQPAFRPEAFTRYLPVMLEEVTATAAGWADGRVIAVEDHAYRLIARIITRTMFSADRSSTAVARIAAVYPDFHHGIGRQMRSPSRLFDRLPTRANRRFRQACRTVNEVVDGAIEGRRRGDGGDHDLLTLMVGEGLTDREMRDQIVTMLTGGIGTSASALGWALHFLSLDEELADAVAREARAILPARLRQAVPGSATPAGAIPAGVTLADVTRLDLARRVVAETLRFYPSAWFYSRTVTEPVELAGEHLRPGTAVLLSPYLLHHRPDLYPDPERFDVDRWSPARAAELPRRAYVPFGTGSRKCIGDVYSLTELTLAVAVITSRWRLEPPPGPLPAHLVEPRPWTVIHPAPLRLRLRSRP
ncbi:cytochrome P450 [Kitasatospora xanthocidica]|uniref:cytochrome P450 n=1 Tax=Kitasatospora xanthocidica TaxID=83382 RepID=UPI00167BAE12|nr:cytochrome P450 [Kitasatospora xanthocidica]GHF37740.1 cytochrome P450 [Kitasatospora xanthocidica]